MLARKIGSAATAIAPSGLRDTVQAWGIAKAHGGTAIVFAIASPKHAIAQAFVVKSALSTAESAGYTDLTVLVSSVGDHDSAKRYAHELGNFFKSTARNWATTCARRLPRIRLRRRAP